MKKSFVLLILIFTAGIYFNGCVPSKPKENIEVLPSERLIKRIEANRRRINNFQGSGSLNIETKQINANASFKVTLIRPDSLYLEVFGPFGIDVAQALVTNNDFIFYDIFNNTVHKGKSNSDVLEKIFKVDLSFADLTDAFVGAVNLTSKLTSEPSNYEVIFDKYILTYTDSLKDIKSKYKIDIKELAVTDYQLMTNDEDIILEGIYSNFELVNGISIPTFIQIVNNEEMQRININYKNLKINKDDVKISLNIPDDAKLEQW